MIARTASRRRAHRSGLIAVLLGLLGVVLVVVAACTSSSGPPMPSPEAAGTIDPTTSVSISSVSASTTSVSTATTSTPSSSEPATETPSSTETTPSPEPAPATTPPLLLPAAHPVSLAIPKLGVQSTLLDLGLNSDGTLEVPSINDPASPAGWYDGSPEPGTQGPSIILGHIDSKKYGPGVFYDLGTLLPGDTVEITRDDGTVAIFTIDGVRTYAKADFPTIQVYGNLDHSGLRLITCGGVFNSDSGHYEDNIIAFASLTGSRAA